jgi:hypothetical protein
MCQEGAPSWLPTLDKFATYPFLLNHLNSCARGYRSYRLYRHPVAGATNALVGLLGARPARGGVAQHQGILVRVTLRVPTGELCLVGHAIGDQQV